MDKRERRRKIRPPLLPTIWLVLMCAFWWFCGAYCMTHNIITGFVCIACGIATLICTIVS